MKIPNFIVNLFKPRVVNQSTSMRKIRKTSSRVLIAINIPNEIHSLLMNAHPEYEWMFVNRGRTVMSLARFIRRLEVPTFLVWENSESKLEKLYMQSTKNPVWRLDEGFFRLSGNSLPVSFAIDRYGHSHYDALGVSHLEDLISGSQLTRSEEQATSLLLGWMTDAKLSKYVGERFGHARSYYDRYGRKKRAQKRILVIGQREDDDYARLSRCGYDNGSLVNKAREEHPTAQIFYMPDPDVVTGFSRMHVSLDTIASVCHVIERPMSMHSALESIDEVYAISSLRAFEAVIRNKPVTLVGQPFFAGWGLTRDLCPIPRRVERQLELPVMRDELLHHIVGMACVRYMRYVNPLTRTASDVDEFMALMVSNRRQSEERAKKNKNEVPFD